MIQDGAKLSFERIVDEYARWRAVPKQDRSPAPGWWWGPAFEVLGIDQAMPAEWCVNLELPDSATYADGARIFLGSLAEQKFLPWPGDFPGRARHSDSP
jgi:hypothetical protein